MKPQAPPPARRAVGVDGGTKGQTMTQEHATETREKVEYRYGETFCIEEGCEYNGERAVQGHCHSQPRDETERYMTALFEECQRSLKWMRKQYGDKFAEYLEHMWEWEAMGHRFNVDQLVRLRRENARLSAVQEALLGKLREIEQHCPCGARPESPATHPHVGGCPVYEALAIASPRPAEGTAGRKER